MMMKGWRFVTFFFGGIREVIIVPLIKGTEHMMSRKNRIHIKMAGLVAIYFLLRELSSIMKKNPFRTRCRDP